MQKQHFKIKSFGKQQKTKTTLFCITHYFPTERRFQIKHFPFAILFVLERLLIDINEYVMMIFCDNTAIEIK